MAAIILLVDFLDMNRTFSTAPIPLLATEPLIEDVVTQQGLSALSASLSETDNTVQLAGCSVRLVNTDNLLDTFTAPLEQTSVRIRLGFDTLPLAQYLTIFTGVVDRYTATWQTLDLSLVDASVKASVDLSVTVGTVYPDALSSAIGTTIPVYLGVHTHVAGIQVDATATPTFVLGFGIQRLNAVYLNGNILGADQIQATRVSTSIADLIVVTLLLPPGENPEVTAGINAAEPLLEIGGEGDPIPPEETTILVNGDFETGDTTGWSNAGHMAFDIVKPQEGAVAALVANTSTVEAAPYQEFATVAGRLYSYDLWYRNEDTLFDASANLLVNGSFDEPRVLFPKPGEVLPPPTGGSASGWFFQVLGDTAPVLSFPNAGQPDGPYCLKADVPVDNLRPNATTFLFTLTQDVLTTPGTAYTFAMSSLSYDQTGGSGGGGLPFHDTTSARFMIGTPGDALGIASGSAPRLHAWTSSLVVNGATVAQVNFVATGPITRVTLEGEGTRLFIVDRYLPIYFDQVVLQPAEPQSLQSRALILLGPADEPSALLSLLAPFTKDWTELVGTFTPATTTTRLTLASQGDVLTIATGYDDVIIADGTPALVPLIVTDHEDGENPVDAILSILHTFRPLARYDRASFALARALLRDWLFKGTLTNPGDLATLLQTMARECRTILNYGPEGPYFLDLLYGDSAPVLSFQASNIVRQTLKRESSPLDNLATSVYVYAVTGDEEEPLVVWATPTETSLIGAAGDELVALCAATQATYGVTKKFELHTSWIFDEHTANLMLNFLVRTMTMTPLLDTFSSWLDAVPARIGQRVQIDHPLVSLTDTINAQIVATTFDPATMTMGLKAREQELVPDIGHRLPKQKFVLTRAAGDTPATPFEWYRFPLFHSFLEFQGTLYAGVEGRIFQQGIGFPYFGPGQVYRYTIETGWEVFFTFPNDLPHNPPFYVLLLLYQGQLTALVSYDRQQTDEPPYAILWILSDTEWVRGLDLGIDLRVTTNAPGNLSNGARMGVEYQGKLYLVSANNVFTSAPEDVVRIWVTDGVTVTLSQEFSLSNLYLSHPQLAVFANQLYLSLDGDIWRFDNPSWAMIHSFGSVFDYEDGEGVWMLQIVNEGALLAAVVKANAFQGSTPGLAASETQLWFYDGVTWTMEALLGPVAFLYDAKFLDDGDRLLIALTASNRRNNGSEAAHAEVWAYRYATHTVGAISGKKTFACYGQDFPDYVRVDGTLKYGVNGLLYLALSVHGSTNVFVSPTVDIENAPPAPIGQSFTNTIQITVGFWDSTTAFIRSLAKNPWGFCLDLTSVDVDGDLDGQQTTREVIEVIDLGESSIILHVADITAYPNGDIVVTPGPDLFPDLPFDIVLVYTVADELGMRSEPAELTLHFIPD